MKTIGENISYFRKNKKMTQEELAEKMSVTAQAVSKWETDTSYPDITVIKYLADVLGVTVDELINGKEIAPSVKSADPEKIGRRILKIEVKNGDTSVKTRIPVSLIKAAISLGNLSSLIGEDTALQVKELEGMIDSGMTGPITEVETGKATVYISVVDYEN